MGTEQSAIKPTTSHGWFGRHRYIEGYYERVAEINARNIGILITKQCGNKMRHPYLDVEGRATLEFLRAANSFIDDALHDGADLRNAAFILRTPERKFVIMAGDGDWEYQFCQDADGEIYGRCVRFPLVYYLWDQSIQRAVRKNALKFLYHLSTEDVSPSWYRAPELSKISYHLGLKIDFLDKLKLFDDDKLASHLSLEEWILNILSNNYEDTDDEELKKELSKDLLIELGFRDNSQAIETILSRSELSHGHVEPIELVKRFVKDELKYHPVFAQELYRFPYTDQACVRCEKDFDDKMISVMQMNLARLEDPKELFDHYISKHIEKLRDGNSVILFHGTDHSSAIDILNRGIDIHLGRLRHDFSDGVGFYLNNDYKHSETWSLSQTRKPAVLVFKVPKTFLEESKSLDLSREEKRDEWLQILTENRSGRPSKKLRNKLKTYEIIRGPMSKRSDDASKSYEPKEDSHQVCIINDDCAEEMQQFLNTAIFYE